MKQVKILVGVVAAVQLGVSLAQTYLPQPLPGNEGRVVIGTWKLIEPDIACTRSIERLHENYYMVARCSEGAGVDGTKGLPIEKISERIYQSQAGVTYEIQTDGMLFVVKKGSVDMRGTPQAELWPQ
ncbi:hypothetical protein [Hydrogenophaga sp. 5NK40-0174]|uniref:hypothetical protein n=1 Tax=Hydrogenophaga sp. 5NK40-0174 TaxID=3127649 RepID=UPI00310AB4D8